MSNESFKYFKDNMYYYVMRSKGKYYQKHEANQTLCTLLDISFTFWSPFSYNQIKFYTE
jgi:hypothetical protein